jgi:hypothetical protein
MSDKWSSMKLEELRSVAKKYKPFHSLGNISKANKGELIETLKKFMSWEGETLKQKPNATPIEVEKVAPKASKAKPPKVSPAPATPVDMSIGEKKKITLEKTPPEPPKAREKKASQSTDKEIVYLGSSGVDHAYIIRQDSLENQVIKETFYRMVTDDDNNFNSASKKTKIRNQIMKANGSEMADLIQKILNPNSKYRVNFFTQERFIKTFGERTTNDFVKEVEKKGNLKKLYL